MGEPKKKIREIDFLHDQSSSLHINDPFNLKNFKFFDPFLAEL